MSAPLQRLLRALLLLAVVCLLPASCGLPEYKFSDPVEEPPLATPTNCRTDADCKELPATRTCDVERGYCAECLPGGKPCGEGLYCTEDGRCALGCNAPEDCRDSLNCDAATHRCVGCTEDEQCLSGTRCRTGTCTPSCEKDAECPSGFSCCDGRCRNLSSDSEHCSACGKACADKLGCINGLCGIASCKSGFAECNADPTDPCETDVRADPLNCGRCRLACASNFCSGGTCTTAECQPGFADCNQEEGDRCEADLNNSVSNCGRCGKSCSAVNGEAACSDGACSIACEEGFDDCDEDVESGCETNLQQDSENCGACGVACESVNGSNRCSAGICAPVCANGFEDCDGDPANGCETATGDNLSHCGGCGQRCAPRHATGVCEGGVCEPKCDVGFADCNGDFSDGCEADLAAPETCGVCNNACSDAGGVATCTDGECGIECEPGFADCINGLSDGCETNTNSNAIHCGNCETSCPNTAGTAACYDGECGYSNCIRPNAECDGNAETSCETNINTNPDHCGECSHACVYPNALGVCVGGSCTQGACAAGYADCTAAPGCETQLATTANCRSCGDVCINAHGSTACRATGCVPTCAPGFGDCDGNLNNGCETPLTTLSNCGACGAPCSKAHASASCGSGTCQIEQCESGYGNCDDEAARKSGCETRLNTTSDCGGCGVACNLPRGSESCGTGVCRLLSCDAGYADCSSAPGCETQLGTLSNCSACGDACSNNHGRTTCTANVCTPSCDAGFKSCDGNLSNGCESNIRTLSDCGDCGVDCDLPNASESCATGTCTRETCNNGFADCTSAAGCETALGSLSNCRGCGDGCFNAHGTTSCQSSGCVPSCSPGWETCDTSAQNGCETSIWSVNNCGACGEQCDIPNSAESCGGGTCSAVSCSAGFADCTAAAGCETQIGTLSNCRACGESCTNQHGTTTCTSSGCLPVCATGFRDCDGIPDNGCETNIRTLENCGTCGVACTVPNGEASCSTGTCVQMSCADGFADCNSTEGCETQLGTTSNCATCGNTCSNAHGSNSCAPKSGSFDCAPECEPGFADCDGNPDNGCESSLTSPTSCGACGVDCTLPNATTSCTSAGCTLVSCKPGFADCTSAPGCETSTGTVNACAGCGDTCTNGHGSTSCVNGDCAPSCSAGWKSCDGQPDNGCERSITTLTDCGDCGQPCSIVNGVATCASGTCALSACNAGFDDCTTAPGCETQLGTTMNCKACGDACVNAHGSNACAGSAGNYTCDPSCSAGFDDCDGNPSNGCERDITTISNCGACNQACSGSTPFCVDGGCQGILPIQLVNANASGGSTGGSPLNIPHVLQTTAERRVVVVMVASDGNNQTGARISGVSYMNGATALPLTLAHEVWSGNRVWSGIFWIRDAQLPAPGSYSVRVTGSGSEFAKIASVYELKGVDQTNPVDNAGRAVAGGATGNCGTSDPNHSVTTVTNNTWVLSTVGTFGTAAGSVQTGQTQTHSSVSGMIGFKASYKPNLPIGINNIRWDMTNCNAAGHALAALKPATAP